jgi:hypothetical protein
MPGAAAAVLYFESERLHMAESRHSAKRPGRLSVKLGSRRFIRSPRQRGRLLPIVYYNDSLILLDGEPRAMMVNRESRDDHAG